MQASIRWLCLVFAVSLLAACATPQTGKKTSSASIRKAQTPSPTTSIPSPSSVSDGGYFQNDGPAAFTPVNLDAVPDALPKVEALNPWANRPYTALGQTFVPDTTDRSYQARGMASWYGRQFHGRKTSSGEPYDMFSMSAAHPTLPIPSYAKVTNVRNGKSVIVRINDRGPFHKSRLIDLSYAAAHRLDYLDNGRAEVVVERVLPTDGLGDDLRRTGLAKINQTDSPLSRPETLRSADGSSVFLQLGAFSTHVNAEIFRSRMQGLLDDQDTEGEVKIVNHDGLYKVRLGPFITVSRARDVAQRLNVQTVVMR